MNLVELWNGLAELWARHVLVAGLAAVGVYVVAALAWRVGRRRWSAHTGFALFLMPLVALVLAPLEGPVLRIELGEQVARYVPAELREAAPSAAPAHAARAARPADVDGAPAASAPPPVASGPRVAAAPRVVAPRELPRPSALAWLFTAWLGVVSFLLARLARVQLDTQRLVRRARPLAPAQARRVRRLLAGHGAQRVQLVESDALTSPAAWGVRRWTILLPSGLCARLDDDALAWMLLHELAHLRRLDPLVEAAQRVVQILWCFHPLVWRVRRELEELRECACDEAALARLHRPERRELVEALLEVAAGGPAAAAPRLALQSLQKDSLLMKKRILRLMDTSRSPRRGLAPRAVPLLALVGALPLVSLRVEGAPASRGTRQDVDAVRATLDDARSAARLAEVPFERAARSALTHGVDYLVAKQREDGAWTAGPGVDQEVGEFTTAGVTAFVLLALQHAQERAPRPELAAALQRGTTWLAGAQDSESGLFGGYVGYRSMASHAVATRAWIVTHRGAPADTWRPQTERALAAIYRARNPYGAWRFSDTPDGENDSFMTSLMLLALAEARDAGFDVPRDESLHPLEYLEELYDPDSGRTGYDTVGSRPPRLAGRVDEFPAKYSEMTTALAISARLAWGQSPIEQAAIRRGAPVVVDVAPSWNRDFGTIDYYAWLFGSEALARLGGYQLDYWRAKLCEVLAEHQRVDEEGRVWWPAVDAWSLERGTIHSTVMCVLSLQAVLE